MTVILQEQQEMMGYLLLTGRKREVAWKQRKAETSEARWKMQEAYTLMCTPERHDDEREKKTGEGWGIGQVAKMHLR